MGVRKRNCKPDSQAGVAATSLTGVNREKSWLVQVAIGLGRLGAVAGPAIAGYLIASGLDMSANYYVFAVPMAIGGILAYRLHVK